MPSEFLNRRYNEIGLQKQFWIRVRQSQVKARVLQLTYTCTCSFLQPRNVSQAFLVRPNRSAILPDYDPSTRLHPTKSRHPTVKSPANVSEKTSSESDSDPFDRVLRIKKRRWWREEGGSQPSCGAAAVSRERSHDQDGASQKSPSQGLHTNRTLYAAERPCGFRRCL